MMLIVVGFVGSGGYARQRDLHNFVKQRQADLKQRVSLVLTSDHLHATVKALDIAASGTGKIVTICGSFKDITLPDDHHGFGLVEWRESWFSYLEKNSIAFTSLDKVAIIPEATLAITTIRQFQRATEVLSDSVRKLQRQQKGSVSYVCGRPPYGYRVTDGAFAVDEKQSKAVRFIFSCKRRGVSVSDIVLWLKKEFSAGGLIKGKSQYWDRAKVRRILMHKRLYCLGEKIDRLGRQTFPALAFLPASWVDTPTTNTTSAATAAKE